MSIEYTFRVLPGHLQLDLTGTFDQADALAMYSSAFALAAEHERDAVLIDARAVQPPEPTLMQRFDQAIHIAGIHQRQVRRVRLAILGNEPIIDPNRFGEIVATNRGANVKVFTDEQLALDWLLARPKTG